MSCLQEDCANWDGHSCPCRVLDLEPVDVRESDDDWWNDCDHDWLDRPESDTHECRACGIEGSGPPPVEFVS